MTFTTNSQYMCTSSKCTTCTGKSALDERRRNNEGRDFAAHPVHILETLVTIVIAYDAKLLTSNRYRDGEGTKESPTKYCALGVLFTEDQLNWLDANDLNRRGWDTVIQKIGYKNFKAVTGLTRGQAELLQVGVDCFGIDTDDFHKIITKIRKVVADPTRKTLVINKTRFNLG